MDFIDKEFRPVTTSFGLLAAPLGKVRPFYQEWTAKVDLPRKRIEVNTDFRSAFRSIAPLSAQMSRTLMIQLSNGWTAFFQNGILGSDPFPPISYMSQEMQVTGMAVRSGSAGNEWVVFESPERGGGPIGVRRTVSAVRESSRWKFHQNGIPFDFEELDFYERPKLKDRFPDELFTRYLSTFDLHLTDTRSLIIDRKTPAVILERSPWRDPPPEYSYLEIQQGTPWKKRPRISTKKSPALRRILVRLNRDGHFGDSQTPRPLLSLEEFFDGNDSYSSIGYNFSPQPSPYEFFECFKAIRQRANVHDVLVQVNDMESPDWPSTDTLWVITSASNNEVNSWLGETFEADDLLDGWEHGPSLQSYPIPAGMRAVGIWYD